MKVASIDHIVLTVKDIAETVAFYESVLDMVATSFSDDRVALKFGNQKINLHQHGKEFEPKANAPMPGSADLCFITNEDLQSAMQEVESKNVNIIEGPVSRMGAMGPISSFYFRDPDDNLIEVSNYSLIK